MAVCELNNHTMRSRLFDKLKVAVLSRGEDSAVGLK